MNNFDNHVKLFEKMLLIDGLHYSNFLKKGLDFDNSSKPRFSRVFERKRLKNYLSKMNTIMDYNEYVAEYRKGLKYGFRDE